MLPAPGMPVGPARVIDSCLGAGEEDVEEEEEEEEEPQHVVIICVGDSS